LKKLMLLSHKRITVTHIESQFLGLMESPLDTSGCRMVGQCQERQQQLQFLHQLLHQLQRQLPHHLPLLLKNQTQPLPAHDTLFLVHPHLRNFETIVEFC
jgi:hypothetical protein